MTEPAIRLRALTKEYPGGVVALAGVDLDVERGRVFGLLGRNGSGKTTMVRILCGLTRPTAGTAAVLGLSVADEAARVRRLTGVTMQEAALDAGMTGREHLRLAAGLWGLPRARRRVRCDELLERFGLTGAADRRIGTYSGGMQRRLDIATALLVEPALLLLDEPTTGLDPQSRRALWEEIRRLSRDGTTIFLTTQYLEEADALTDRVAVLHEGALLTEATVAELKRRHGRTVVELRPASAADLDRLRALAAGTAAVRANGALELELPGERAAAAVAELIARLHDERIELDGLQVRPSTLEDVFVELTGAAV